MLLEPILYFDVVFLQNTAWGKITNTEWPTVNNDLQSHYLYMLNLNPHTLQKRGTIQIVIYA